MSTLSTHLPSNNWRTALLTPCIEKLKSFCLQINFNFAFKISLIQQNCCMSETASRSFGDGQAAIGSLERLLRSNASSHSNSINVLLKMWQKPTADQPLLDKQSPVFFLNQKKYLTNRQKPSKDAGGTNVHFCFFLHQIFIVNAKGKSKHLRTLQLDYSWTFVKVWCSF